MKKGFSLIELLVVLATIALLVSILSPVARRALAAGDASVCKSNLRQLALAAQDYMAQHSGRFPLALRSDASGQAAWDVTVRSPGRYEPGLLFQGHPAGRVQQCPSFRGADNWQGEPFSGYNYNVSYLGGMYTELRGRIMVDVPSARLSSVRNPSNTVMFGEGTFGAGANKFMRSPQTGNLDPHFHGRQAGAQAFRHRGRSHAAFVDGHVGEFRTRFLAFGDDAGFLSADNEVYDLD